MIKLIGIDFDETLALTDDHWNDCEEKFYSLAAKAGASPEQLANLRDKFPEVEKEDVRTVGFGCALQLKTFIDLSLKYIPELVDGALLSGINNLVEELRNMPIPFFDDVREFMDQVNIPGVKVAIITKGEIHHQSDKLLALEAYLGNKSWNSSYIIGDKTEAEYLKVLRAEGVKPEEFVMVGDSVKSDINPVLKMGGEAIHLKRPSREGIKWAFEQAQAFPGTITVATLDQAMDALNKLTAPAMQPKFQRQYSVSL